MQSFPNLNEWMERYEIELRADRAARPDRYMWTEDKMGEVLDKMRQGFAGGPGRYNKDSNAIRACCKHFGIAMTYTAIDRFIRGGK